MQEEQDDDYSQEACQGCSEEAPLPSCGTYQGTHEHEGKAFSYIVRSAEEAVECAADAQREPAGQRDDCRRGTHRLRPSVDGPADSEEHEECGVAYHSHARADSEYSHDEVHQYGYGEAGGHEPLDVGTVGEEAVYEFADGVSPVEAGPDYTELGCVEQAGVNQRLLHHAH